MTTGGSAAPVRGHTPLGADRWWALGFVLTGYLAVFAGVTTMNVALPAAQTDLGFADAERQLVITLYALSFGALMVPAGRLADVIGLSRCFAAGMAGFGAASLLGGLADSTAVLLTSRALQGATGALVAATGLALLSVMFPSGRERARAFGVLGTVMGLGTAGSFVVAGALVDGLSWRGCLLVNVPLALVVVVGLLRTAPATPPPPRGESRLDLVGAALVMASVALLVGGFDRAGVLGWSSTTAMVLLAVGLLLALLLLVWLLRSAQPLIPRSLIVEQHRVIAFAAVFMVGIAMFAGMFLLTGYLQEILGYSALLTGLGFVPFGVAAVLVSHLLAVHPLGSAAGAVGPRTVLVVGLLAAAAAIASLALLDPTTGYVGVLPAMLLLGGGGTAVMVTGAASATFGAGRNSGVAGALVNSAQQIGAALGTGLLTAVAASATARAGRGVADPDSVIHGYAVAGLVGSALLLVAALLVTAAPDDCADDRPQHKARLQS